MAQITWRNVANTVTGNPAAALGAANSAFASAGAGAKRMGEVAAERDKLARAQLTDDALQGIFGTGDLAGVDQDANFGAILKAQQDKLTDDAQIGASNARQAASAEQLRVSKLDNSPEARRIKEERAQAQLQNDQARLRLAESQNARQQVIFERNTKRDQDAASLDAGYDEYVANTYAPFQRRIDEAILAVNGSDKTPTQKGELIQSLNTSATAEHNRLQDEGIAGFLAQRKQEAPGTTSPAVLSQSGVGQRRNELRQQADTLQAQDRAASRAQLDKSIKALGDFVAGGGSPKILAQIGQDPDTGQFRFLDKKAAQGNTISEQDAIAEVKTRTSGTYGFFGLSEDKEMPQEHQDAVSKIWNQVGGNAQLFEQAIEGIEYDEEVLWDDDLNNVRSTANINKLILPYRQAADAEFQRLGAPKRKAASANDQVDAVLKAIGIKPGT